MWRMNLNCLIQSCSLLSQTLGDNFMKIGWKMYGDIQYFQFFPTWPYSTWNKCTLSCAAPLARQYTFIVDDSCHDTDDFVKFFADKVDALYNLQRAAVKHFLYSEDIDRRKHLKQLYSKVEKMIEADTDKTSQTDSAPTWCVKEFRNQFSQLIALVFNKSFESRGFPENFNMQLFCVYWRHTIWTTFHSNITYRHSCQNVLSGSSKNNYRSSSTSSCIIQWRSTNLH